jgi:hypothetical protein
VISAAWTGKVRAFTAKDAKNAQVDGGIAEIGKAKPQNLTAD